MLTLPKEIISAYDDLLIQKQVPIQQRGAYKKWLRFYLDFCDKYHFNTGKSVSLSAFVDKLRSKGQGDDLCEQARQAVMVYAALNSRKHTNDQPIKNGGFTEETAVADSRLGRHKPVMDCQQQNTFQSVQIIEDKQNVINESKANDYSSLKQTGASWTAVYDALEAEIKIRHYSPKTLSSYRAWLRKFQSFLKSKDSRLLNQQDVKDFLTDLAVDKKVAASTQNQAFNALLFLFRHVLKQEFGEIKDVPRAKRKPYIPVVLSRAEVNKVFKQLKDPCSLPAKLLYGCGLRISECLNLRLQDFNLDEGLLTIHNGKGKKDRVVPLPQSIMSEIEAQIVLVADLYDQDLANEKYAGVFLPDSLGDKYKNAGKEFSWQWFFPAKTLTFIADSKEYKRYHLHDTQLQKAIKSAVKRAKLLKRTTAHTFRHSFASHLLQANYDIRTIQVLMGHSDVRTTMIYVQTIPSLTLKEAKSPLDF
ncbi:MAG: integron integrase [Methylomarinum sp.]|nr:integron integrase [Methylomarinum sp.]